MTNKGFYHLVIISIIIIGIESCGPPYYFRSSYKESNRLLYDNLKTKVFLKAHHKNGNISILRNTWHVDTVQNVLTGVGEEYDFNRNKITQGPLAIPIDSIALYETNKKLDKTESGRITALAVLAGVDVLVDILCLSNPKACYGSCPTFYMDGNENFHYADAEGFSNAILPTFEYADIDALKNATCKDGHLSLTMKNEALETHCVNEVKLLAYPRAQNDLVYHSPSDEFYFCTNIYRPIKAFAPEGDITQLIKDEDHCERFSYADERDLSTKEEIVIDFGKIESINQMGLVLDFRQTLMTTYFIYSALGYMGDEAGDLLSKLNTSPEFQNKLDQSIRKELGGIEVYAWNQTSGMWEWQQSFNETGPIAINRQIIPLTKFSASTATKIKIKLNKGLWRIDFVAMTNIKKKVQPIPINPSLIYNKGHLDVKALANMKDTSKYIISMPGDEYKFVFEMPDPTIDYDLFLYSKGYYLEWMRAHWIKDKNLLKLRQLLNSPKDFLTDEAHDYKRYEVLMEEQFWNSKVDTKTFSYDGL